MDTTITSESTDSGTAVTEEPGQTTGGESAASQSADGTSKEGGGSQESTESGQSQEGSRRGSSLYKDVIKLRAQNRELREQFSSVEQLRQDFAALREELNRRSQGGPAKTPTNFWQDPEAVLEAKLEEKLERLQNSMFERFDTTREQEWARQENLQRSASAAEFIRSQPGYDQSDDEDLVDIIKENNLASLGPEKAANIAWLMLQQSRGVGDRGLAKRQAASVQGQPPGVGFGRKMWNKTEFDQAVDMVESKMRSNPNDPKITELFNELMAAHKEGRVK